MEVIAIEPVRKSVVVDTPIERAFELFTARFGDWWPTDHHIGKQAYENSFIEPRAGGRWYERAIDGSECDWGRVIEWDPPHRVLLSWKIRPDWQADADDAKASEVEVRFISESPGATRVELEHRHLERHGDGADQYRTALNSGWPGVLQKFVDFASKTGENGQ